MKKLLVAFVTSFSLLQAWAIPIETGIPEADIKLSVSSVFSSQQSLANLVNGSGLSGDFHDNQGSAAALAVGLSGCPEMAAKSVNRAGQRPNIVFILADDLGWKDVGYAGSTFYRTPNIDRLAHDGMRFSQAYSAACVCSPSRGAIYSGKNPARTGLTDVFNGPGEPDDVLQRVDKSVAGCQTLVALQRLSLPRSERTFGDVLTEAGYATAFFGKWHCGEIPGYEPDERGWQLAKGYRVAKAGGATKGHWGDSYPSPDCLAHLPDLKPRDYLADVLTEEAVSFIRAHTNQPFHLVLSHYLVHQPLQPKPGMAEPYRQAPVADQRNPVYAAMIESLDQSVGRILQTLRDTGLDDNTLIVFTSDNGGLSAVTSNYPLMGGKSFPFEAGMRVPLVMRWPAHIKPGSACAERVIGMDFYPTFLNAAGLPLMPRQHIDGVSLLPVMSGTGHIPARPLVYHFPHYTGNTGPNSVLTEDNWKLIRFYNDSAGRFLLYNLAADPHELKDRSAEQPDKVRAMDDRLSGLLKEMEAQFPVPNPNYNATRRTVFTRKTTLDMAERKRSIEESQLRPLARP